MAACGSSRNQPAQVPGATEPPPSDEMRLAIELCAHDENAESSATCRALVAEHRLVLPPRLELAAFRGCWHVSGERYAAACFEPSRAFFELKSGGWDAFPVEWRRVSRSLFASHVPALGAEMGVGSLTRGGRTELALCFAESLPLLEVLAGLRLSRPSATEQHRLAHAATALPDVHATCERARSCVAGVNALAAPSPPGAAPDLPPVVVVAITDYDSLLQCLDGRAQALALAKLRQLDVPDECR